MSVLKIREPWGDKYKAKYINYDWRIVMEDYSQLPKESYFKPDNCNISEVC